MTGIDYTNIVDNDFPIVDRTKVVPGMAEVAPLARARTVDQLGEENGAFTKTTRPASAEREPMIQQASEWVTDWVTTDAQRPHGRVPTGRDGPELRGLRAWSGSRSRWTKVLDPSGSS